MLFQVVCDAYILDTNSVTSSTPRTVSCSLQVYVSPCHYPRQSRRAADDPTGGVPVRGRPAVARRPARTPGLAGSPPGAPLRRAPLLSPLRRPLTGSSISHVVTLAYQAGQY